MAEVDHNGLLVYLQHGLKIWLCNLDLFISVQFSYLYSSGSCFLLHFSLARPSTADGVSLEVSVAAVSWDPSMWFSVLGGRKSKQMWGYFPSTMDGKKSMQSFICRRYFLSVRTEIYVLQVLFYVPRNGRLSKRKAIIISSQLNACTHWLWHVAITRYSCDYPYWIAAYN